MHVDKHQSFLQVDFNTLGIKDAYKVLLSFLLGMIKHSESTQSNKFAISLQKRSLERSSFFACRWTSKFLQVEIIVFDGSGQSTQTRKLVIFLQRVAAAFVFYCDAKHSDISWGSSHVYCYILVSLHSQTRNFLPKDRNTIIKKPLCGEGLPSLFFLLQVDVFQ